MYLQYVKYSNMARQDMNKKPAMGYKLDKFQMS